MPTNIDRNEVQRLVREGAQLVEVLPAKVYEGEHLPGAINLPLTHLNRQDIAMLQRDRLVIVYCYDAQWDLSPRAASRLETLGFTQVYDYVTGKVDWLANGLPTEGKEARSLRAKDCVRPDTPSCRLGDSLGEVWERVQAAGDDACVVVNEDDIVLGFLSGEAFAAAPESTVEQVMDPGPPTIRPHVSLAEIAEYLQHRDRDRVLITTAEGRLMGVLYRQDAQRLLGEASTHKA
jgi:rhodanese-related sulfurtransferase/CBS domain-containing protein